MFKLCDVLYDISDDIEMPLRMKEPTWFEVKGIFDEDTPAESIDMALDVISACQQHIFIALDTNASRIVSSLYQATETRPARILKTIPNLWACLRITSQEEAGNELPAFVQGISANRLLYIEPAERIDLMAALNGVGQEMRSPRQILANWLSMKLEWVVVSGGETAIHPQWVKDIKEQCVFAGVPFWFNSWGDYIPRPFVSIEATLIEAAENGNLKWGTIDVNGTWYPFSTPMLVHGRTGFWRPRECTMYLVGRERSGCMLEGREWQEMPYEIADRVSCHARTISNGGGR